jgi:hypothetical protein
MRSVHRAVLSLALALSMSVPGVARGEVVIGLVDVPVLEPAPELPEVRSDVPTLEELVAQGFITYDECVTLAQEELGYSLGAAQEHCGAMFQAIAEAQQVGMVVVAVVIVTTSIAVTAFTFGAGSVQEQMVWSSDARAVLSAAKELEPRLLMDRDIDPGVVPTATATATPPRRLDTQPPPGDIQILAAATRTPTPGSAPPARLAGDTLHCKDFKSQAEAQAVLRANPRDPHGLDPDRDGLACELNPSPRDLVRVPR